ncbi:hypothetical protein TNCV_1778041 [Trichonephila clavipes]|nr:hypothetical protein TNCV_1778041 [Trichonephila clavipes]
MLAKNFKKYFLDEDSLVASYEWIRDLFQDTPEGLSTSEEEIFIDFTSSEKLKGNFVINRSLNLGSLRLIEDETFNGSDIMNNLIDYEDEQEEPDSLRVDKIYAGLRLIDWLNINVALFSYTRAFGDGPRNFEPWSSDVDDT